MNIAYKKYYIRKSNTVILVRLSSAQYIANRLLGTTISLIGASNKTTKCGTINSVNPGGSSVDAQTYTVPCPVTTNRTKAVYLYDDVMEKSGDLERNRLIMNVAEMMVYELITQG